jgi:hypothetical protein
VVPRLAHRASLRRDVDYADPCDGYMSDFQHLSTLDRHNQDVGITVLVPTSAQASAAPRARGRARPRRGTGHHHPAPARAHRPRDHQHVLARNRSERDRQRGPLPPAADDARQRSPQPIGHQAPCPTGAAPRLMTASAGGSAETDTYPCDWSSGIAATDPQHAEGGEIVAQNKPESAAGARSAA